MGCHLQIVSRFCGHRGSFGTDQTRVTVEKFLMHFQPLIKGAQFSKFSWRSIPPPPSPQTMNACVFIPTMSCFVLCWVKKPQRALGVRPLSAAKLPPPPPPQVINNQPLDAVCMAKITYANLHTNCHLPFRIRLLGRWTVRKIDCSLESAGTRNQGTVLNWMNSCWSLTDNTPESDHTQTLKLLKF